VFLTENSPAMVLVDNAGCSRRSRRPPWNKSTPPTARPTANGWASPRAPPCSSTTRAS
jgi:hypothetical protein